MENKQLEKINSKLKELDFDDIESILNKLKDKEMINLSFLVHLIDKSFDQQFIKEIKRL